MKEVESSPRTFRLRIFYTRRFLEARRYELLFDEFLFGIDYFDVYICSASRKSKTVEPFPSFQLESCTYP